MKKSVLVVSLALVASGAAAQEAPGAAELNQCAAAAQKSNWDGVIAACQKALQLMTDKTHPGPDYYLGLAYSNKKNLAKTVEHYQAFLKKSEGNKDVADAQRAVATRAVAMSLALGKKYQQAIPYLKNAILDSGDDWTLHYQLATAYLRTNDSAGAEKHFARVTQLKPDGAAAFYQAGRLAYIRQDPEAARKYLGKFVALSKGGATLTQAHYLLGDLAAKEGDNATAAEHFEKYMAGNPDPGAQTDAVQKFLTDMKAQGS